MQTIAPAGAIGVTNSTRSVLLTGIAVRTDVRPPRTYHSYVGTEMFLASQAITGNAPPDAHAAGRGEPAERFGIHGGLLRVPEAAERWGYRVGLRSGIWHGALGDAEARWAVDVGAELAPVLRIGPRLPPWEADETASLNFVFIPSFFAGPVWRPEDLQHPFAFHYGAMLSLGVSISSTVVP